MKRGLSQQMPMNFRGSLGNISETYISKNCKIYKKWVTSRCICPTKIESRGNKPLK
jgi:hypothetical protein